MKSSFCSPASGLKPSAHHCRSADLESPLSTHLRRCWQAARTVLPTDHLQHAGEPGIDLRGGTAMDVRVIPKRSRSLINRWNDLPAPTRPDHRVRPGVGSPRTIRPCQCVMIGSSTRFSMIVDTWPAHTRARGWIRELSLRPVALSMQRTDKFTDGRLLLCPHGLGNHRHRPHEAA